MAVQADSGGKDEVKTQFATREGTYRLMTLSEYSRPNRVGYNSGSGSSQVRVSLVTLPPEPGTEGQPPEDRICFNHGKELYIYVYRGIKKAADLTKPVDKKMYKGTNPTCHDFNTVTMTPDSVSLVIGFSTGQIQLIDPIKKELSKLYNEDRLIDKTRVTCIKWVPGSSNLFVASHASGQLYVYNEELGSGSAAPHYQPFKTGDGYSVHTCRAKSTRNPLYRWVVGAEGSAAAINEFAFSPCGTRLAVVSQDGLLRVFHYDTMEAVGRARSYFGGFLCVCWSPDSRYVVVGGEDDLVTVWSVGERRVVARGQGHRSWVSVVAFDPFADDERGGYRLGSVGQDTQLCLWELTEDVLRPVARPRASAHLSPAAGTEPNGSLRALPAPTQTPQPPAEPVKKEDTSLTQRLAGFSFGERRSDHRRNFGLAKATDTKTARTRGGTANGAGDADALRLIGTPACPRFDECPVLEPLVCKKVAHERLTALLFRGEYVVTACADGGVNTWARPARRSGEQAAPSAPDTRD